MDGGSTWSHLDGIPDPTAASFAFSVAGPTGAIKEVRAVNLIGRSVAV